MEKKKVDDEKNEKTKEGEKNQINKRKCEKNESKSREE